MEKASDPFVKDETFGHVACQYQNNYSNHVAKGAFGTVYQATITHRGDFSGAEQVAVKVVHLDRQSESLTDPTTWSKLRQRLQNLPEFRHGHLVTYHKITIAKGSRGGVSIELMMDYHTGEDLRTLMGNLRQQGTFLTEAEAVSYTVQIAKGLEFLHSKQLIHGDLKPSNILTAHSENGERKLAIGDLDDIVQMERDVTCSHDITHLRGTYRYMSPEMLKKFFGQKSENPGRKTDIWSLGCIMLELADRVVGNDQKWLRKNHEKIEVGNEVKDGKFIHLIMDGYVPCATETIPSALTASLQQCLHTASSARISASLLQVYCKFTARKPLTAREFTRQLKARELTQQLKAKDLIIIFGFQDDANRCYLFDPSTKSVTELMLPEVLREDLNILAVSDGKVVCQVGSWCVEVLVWDVQKQTVSPGRSKLLGHMLCPIAVMDKIYFWFKNDDSVQFRMLDLRDGTDVTLELPPYFPSVEGVERYLYGARDGNRIIFTGLHWDETHSWVKCFDTHTGEWDALPALPDRRCGFAMVVLQNTVYVLGGRPYSSTHKSLELELLDRETYNTDLRSCLRLELQSPTRQWETMGHLSEKRCNHCAVISNNRIYVFGGRRRHWRAFGSVPRRAIVDVYDIERELWFAYYITGCVWFDFTCCRYEAANVTLSVGRCRVRPREPIEVERRSGPSLRFLIGYFVFALFVSMFMPPLARAWVTFRNHHMTGR